MDQKTLIILQGPPGCGKSTYCEKNYNTYDVVSMDSIREMCGCVESENGKAVSISQKDNKFVFNIFKNILEKRLSNGVFTVVDCTNLSLNLFKELSEKYEYKVIVKHFNISLDELKNRNMLRGYKNVPENVVINMYERNNNILFEDWYKLEIIE